MSRRAPSQRGEFHQTRKKPVHEIDIDNRPRWPEEDDWDPQIYEGDLPLPDDGDISALFDLAPDDQYHQALLWLAHLSEQDVTDEEEVVRATVVWRTWNYFCERRLWHGRYPSEFEFVVAHPSLYQYVYETLKWYAKEAVPYLADRDGTIDIITGAAKKAVKKCDVLERALGPYWIHEVLLYGNPWHQRNGIVLLYGLVDLVGKVGRDRVLDGIRYATAVKLVYGRLYSLEHARPRERARLAGHRHLDGFVDMPRTLHGFQALSETQLNAIRDTRFLMHSDFPDVEAFCDLSESGRTEWLANHSEEDVLAYQSQQSLPGPIPVDVDAVHPYDLAIPSAEQSSGRQSRNRSAGPIEQDDHFDPQGLDMGNRELSEEMPVAQDDRRQARDAEWQAERERLLERLQEYETLAAQLQRDRRDDEKALEEARQQMDQQEEQLKALEASAARDLEMAKRELSAEREQVQTLRQSVAAGINQRRELCTRLHDSESARESLARQVRESEGQVSRLRNDTQEQMDISKTTIESLEANVQELKDELAKAVQARQDETRRFDEDLDDAVRARQDDNRRFDEERDALQVQLTSLHDDVAVQSAELVTLNANLDAAKSLVPDLTATLEQHAKEALDKSRQVEALKTQNLELTKRMVETTTARRLDREEVERQQRAWATLQQAYTAQAQELESARNQSSDLIRRLSTKLEDIATNERHKDREVGFLRAQHVDIVQESMSAREVTLRECAELRKDVQRLTQELKNKSDAYEAESKTAAKTGQELSREMAEKTRLQKEVADLTDESNRMQRAAAATGHELDDLRVQFTQATARIAEHERQIQHANHRHAASTQRQYNHVLRARQEAKDEWNRERQELTDRLRVVEQREKALMDQLIQGTSPLDMSAFSILDDLPPPFRGNAFAFNVTPRPTSNLERLREALPGKEVHVSVDSNGTTISANAPAIEGGITLRSKRMDHVLCMYLGKSIYSRQLLAALRGRVNWNGLSREVMGESASNDNMATFYKSGKTARALIQALRQAAPSAEASRPKNSLLGMWVMRPAEPPQDVLSRALSTLTASFEHVTGTSPIRKMRIHAVGCYVIVRLGLCIVVIGHQNAIPAVEIAYVGDACYIPPHRHVTIYGLGKVDIELQPCVLIESWQELCVPPMHLSLQLGWLAAAISVWIQQGKIRKPEYGDRQIDDVLQVLVLHTDDRIVHDALQAVQRR
ncbi:hypothetical protein NliqN6_3881 [Naganishia liquefaciens]|uniref:Uncharacterized protein n=1 Tax=Naganishia liquefaciens TaxID=104408 RepID=A0A8H3TUU2_9TREE|nr:hypothetical protein NliqN6_3881 [Naganishia liquefaciens]